MEESWAGVWLIQNSQGAKTRKRPGPVIKVYKASDFSTGEGWCCFGLVGGGVLMFGSSFLMRRSELGWAWRIIAAVPPGLPAQSAWLFRGRTRTRGNGQPLAVRKRAAQTARPCTPEPGCLRGALKIRWAHTGSLRLIIMMIGRRFLRAGCLGLDT